MRNPKNDKDVDELTKIFVNAFNQASKETGVPVKTVAEQVAGEFNKMAEDTARLKAACAEIN